MSAAHLGRPKSPEHAAAISAGRKGMVFSAETRKRMSDSARARAMREGERERLASIGKKSRGFHGTHSAQSRAKMSRSRMGKPCPHARREWYQGIAFRSSWEVRVAKALDALNVRWEYEPKRFAFDGFTYLPDFYLPDDGAYWEVKGWMRSSDAVKIAAFRSTYVEHPLVVIDITMIEALERAAA